MNERRFCILYGSQTGTAQEVAERIWREAKCYHFQATVEAMNDYKIFNLIYERVVIFVCSTTGQGDQPDNMKKFWRFLLKKSLPGNSLQNVMFGVLGLGDSSYVKFNHVAKKLHRRLLSLGGRPICDVGLADDQHDLGADAVVDPWIENLWQVLARLTPMPDGMAPVDRRSLFPPRWAVSVAEGSGGCGDSLQTSFLKWESTAVDNSCVSTVISNQRTTSKDHFQDVRLVRLGLKEEEVRYKPGDVAVVRPHNSQASVSCLLELLSTVAVSPQLSGESVLSVTQSDQGMPVPPVLRQPISVRRLATEFWDLNAVAKRYTFELLSKMTKNELEQEKLEELSSAGGQEELFNYCNRPRRTVLEVLADFPHAVANLPSPAYLFELLQPIRPRSFSIASSPKTHKGELHLLVAVVRYRTKLLAPRLGLCSNYLASLSTGDQLPVTIKPGSLTFPSDEVPMVMVGPGTGVAPFRSFLWERAAMSCPFNCIQFHLFFGCRNREGDFHFQEEWTKLQLENKLSVYTAFSRDQPEKIYVQHVMRESSRQLWEAALSDERCRIFVAGNSNSMPQEVREAVRDVYIKEGGLDKEQAEAVLEKMEQDGLYQTETWS